MHQMDQQKIMQYAQTSFSGVQQQCQSPVQSQDDIIRTRQFFEPVGLHICMMSLILHFFPEQNKNNNMYDIWMRIRVLRYLHIGPPSWSNHQAQACVGHFFSILAFVALDVSESLIKFLNTLVDVPKLI